MGKSPVLICQVKSKGQRGMRFCWHSVDGSFRTRISDFAGRIKPTAVICINVDDNGLLAHLHCGLFCELCVRQQFAIPSNP